MNKATFALLFISTIYANGDQDSSHPLGELIHTENRNMHQKVTDILREALK